nr:flagellin [Anaerobiospirillum thomasii]
MALAQTAEGAMDEMTTMLQRIRTLAVQASNGTNNAKDRDALQQEVTQLSQEITRIACQTKFGGEQILAAGKQGGFIPSTGVVKIQVGAYNGDTLNMKFYSLGFALSGIASNAGVAQLGANVNADGMIMTAAGSSRFSVSSQTIAADSIAGIDKLIAAVDKQRSHLGAMQNRMESSIRNQSNVSMNVSDARARIRDTDFAEETAALTANQILQQASQSILSQANQRPQIALSLLGGR